MKIHSAKRPAQGQVVAVEPKRNQQPLRKRLFPLLIFLLILTGILATYFYYHFLPRARGVLITETFNVSSKRSALIKAIHVRVGDHVKAGQLLVELDTNELEARKAQLIETIRIAEENLPARRASLQLQQDELRLRLDDNLIFRAMDIETARSNLNQDMAQHQAAMERWKGTELELNRRLTLVKSSAVAQASVDESQTRWNALKREVENFERVVEADQKHYEAAQKRYAEYQNKTINVPIDEILRPLYASILEAKAGLLLVEEQMANSRLIAAVDSVVVNVHQQVESGVDIAQPILTLMRGSQQEVEAWVRECWIAHAEPGTHVRLRPLTRTLPLLKGTIRSTAPSMNPIPTLFLEPYERDRIQGLRIQIDLDQPLTGPLGTSFEIIL